MLPELDFSLWFISGKEVFFRARNDIKNIVSQGIPASLTLELPGFNTEVVICFPTPYVTRVYALNYAFSGAFRRPEHYFVGECNSSNSIYTAPEKVAYKYGTRLLPWMQVQRIKEIKRDEDKTVNYVVESGSSGFIGVLIRLFDVSEPQTNRSDEWLTIYHFDFGNESDFQEKWRERAKQLLRLVPANPGTNHLGWQPHGTWRIFTKIKSLPVKQA